MQVWMWDGVCFVQAVAPVSKKGKCERKHSTAQHSTTTLARLHVPLLSRTQAREYAYKHAH